MPKRKPPRKSSRIPKYRHYKPKDLGVVRIDGHDEYLGKYDTDESWERYWRLIAERFGSASTTTVCHQSNGHALTINELIVKYWTERVEVYHVKDGKPTDCQYHIRLSFGPLRRLYGSTLARDFGPKALQLVRDEMIQ